MEPIYIIIILSDLHCGCQFGLCPNTVKFDGGGHYESSTFQKKVWQRWGYFHEEWVPKVTKGEPYVLVLNGDVLDGVHHGAKTQITQNLSDQSDIAELILRPIIEKEKCVKYYHLRGTEAHSGKSGEEEERLAKLLGAVPDEYGNYARWEMWFRLKTALVHFSHAIGVTSSSAYESTAVYKEMVEAFNEAGRWRDEPPDVVVRSHRHRQFETRIATKKGYGISLVTPGWQLKMLDLKTPLPTADGWTTMGDVKHGDILFDETGKRCKVITVGDINLKPETFEVKFSNGEVVKACAEHLWLTTAFVDKPGVSGHGGETRQLTRVRTTKEIYETLRFGKDNELNHKLIMPAPLQIQDKELPIDPYILGCWLGDGDSGSARITCSSFDVMHFIKEFDVSGYQLKPQKIYKDKCPRYRIKNNNGDNFQRLLRKNNLLNNKHIPKIYLRSSFNQRLGLLQGLMDTDGSSDLKGRACFFTTSNDKLKDGMVELLASLGIKYTVANKPSILNSKTIGRHWLFRYFISPDIFPVFKMQRKLCRLPNTTDRKTAPKSRTVMIVSVEPVDPVPMRCIAVDSPSHLYRFGKTMLYTHNTPFVYRLASGRSSTPQIGGYLIRCGDEDEPYTRFKVWRLKRPQEEQA